MQETLTELLAGPPGHLPAIGAPGRDWLDFDGLRALSASVRDTLHRLGLGRSDRVAIVLPNGPEMATAFLTLAQVVTTAPLNPGYRKEEFAFYLEDLKATALLVSDGEDGAAVAAAREAGLAILRLRVHGGVAAGVFELMGAPDEPAEQNPPGPEDVALILHTSGTTSRPKIVPLSHANLAASARNIARSLELTQADRCLNIMPLFHIHGLVAAVMASLAAGGSVWCAPGFDALEFFGWMEEAQPSWFTAVPTMHQAILARAERNAEAIAEVKLRFLRSSSAALPAPVMQELQAVFGVPVIEAYGMTEAAHQMTSNPLPPGVQKPGSVGVEAGPQVRIADEREARLVSEQGEVVISGANVTVGYERNDAANDASFFEAEGVRWFRTGDQGRFDADGYLHLTGRLKEIINRGGEKVSPLEVDGVLLAHPAVAQAVCFALPHPKLGEEVAAAIVLRAGAVATEAELRAFAAERMAAHKVPRRVVLLADIPKGPTGKLQRIGLAETLGLTGSGAG